MKKSGIQAIIRKKKRYFKGVCEGNIPDNILNRDFTASRPNEKWVTDITYLKIKEQHLYLSTVKDLFSNEIVAYQISERNDLQLVIDTVNATIKKRM